MRRVGSLFDTVLISEFMQVTKMNLKEDGTWDVTTNHGTINAKRVINACGKLNNYLNHQTF